ncbi:universal stress protein UspA-like protein [Bernardetia litoralis DSM 6794]|uniref:Universal stress protein UspA-like protein n=1 Tax=Bernardetia litoralis (strain ATCC 23117 / DSM 6794 / NBRC 15988 / NCIMB 1366 / Fx l1 / Sio-4) TaxID=880071 RepID=I4AQ57_BERLS|nr:universal stress protein [Bernardetia litoralis]AFM06092.1 universal stress protein UspA-like protein [Bernardetia litoralis DSM 6794]
MSFKNILVPIDFSTRSYAALAAAADIANQFDSKITLLHIIDVPETQRPEYQLALDTVGNYENSKKEDIPAILYSMKETKRQLREATEKYPKITFDEKVVFDRVHRQIYTVVEGTDVDLIVMGSTGASGLGEVFIGSNTQKVVRNSSCPVLVIKDDEGNFNPRNIVFASDFSEMGGEAARLFPFFKTLYGSTLHLLNIVTPSTFEATPTTQKRMEDFVTDLKVDKADYTINIFNYYTEEEGILTFAEDNKADMILLGTHGRKGFSRFMMGSIAENVANHSEIPVFVFRQD